MSRAGRIVRINPAAGIPGGEVALECEGVAMSQPGACRVWFGTERARVVASSSRRVLAVVPESEQGGTVEVLIEERGERGEPARMLMGAKLAEDLHPVANPAFDPDDGALYVTRSGSRGQELPVTIFRISSNGSITDFTGEITNPTSIAFNESGQMFVTSRADGTVYRVTSFKEIVPFAKNLGVATGLAFDREGRLYVGDRTGTIYRLNGIGEAKPWAELEASVSAYHLAFGPDGYLYVTGPTVSSFDAIVRVDEHGRTSTFYRGLGRPQGLAFDVDGNLYVAASLRGRRGIVRLSPDGSDAELVVAGTNVVGLAFSAAGEMVVATNEAVYKLPLGIHGLLLG